MQKYFKDTAEGLKAYIGKRADMDAETRADLTRQVKAYEILADCEDIDRYNLFNSGAFNSIIKGYVEMMADELEGLTDEQKSGIKGKISALLDRYTAKQAEDYYNNH